MNIQNHTYRLDESKLKPIDANDIDSIALHHMDHSIASINDVTDWHMDDNKWDWIGYGYWVAYNGTVYKCRGHEHINAAVANNNSHIVSIGFQGDYSQDFKMPTPQFNAGIELIRFLKNKLPNIKTIAGHKYWNDTNCPGQFFPLVDMIRRIEVVNVNIEEAKQILLEEKVVNSMDYWQKVIDTTTHFDKFVINVATKIKELKALAK